MEREEDDGGGGEGRAAAEEGHIRPAGQSPTRTRGLQAPSGSGGGELCLGQSVATE